MAKSAILRSRTGSANAHAQDFAIDETGIVHRYCSSHVLSQTRPNSNDASLNLINQIYEPLSVIVRHATVVAIPCRPWWTPAGIGRIVDASGDKIECALIDLEGKERAALEFTAVDRAGDYHYQLSA